MVRRTGDHDGAVEGVVDEVADLDDTTAPGAPPPAGVGGPHLARRWWRGAGGVVVLVVVTIALTAALTGWQQRQLYAAKLVDERATNAVSAGLVTIRQVGEAPPGAGPVPVDLAVDLVNAGDVGVTVALSAIDSGGAAGSAVQLGDPPEPVEVAPGGTASLVAPAVVDCTAVDPSRSGAATGGIAVTVAVPGVERTRPLTTSGPSTTIADQVALVCYPGLFSTIEVAGTSLEQDGRLEVRLYNPGTSDREVTTSGEEGVAVSAEPALPVLVPAGATTAVTLTLVPDCAIADRLSGQVLELVTDQVDGPGAVALPASPESQTITAWVARRTALVCG